MGRLGKVTLALGFLLLCLLFGGGRVWAQEEESEILGEIEGALDLEAIDAGLWKNEYMEEFSFSDTVKELLTGKIPFELEKIPELLGNFFLGELKNQKKMALHILIIVLASAIFTNFVHVFDSSQIADISFYMMYLLISTLLMQSFLSMSRIVESACTSIDRFMKVLLPSYLMTVVFSAGSVSALGFYEITILGMNLLQVVILRIILPVINFYLVLLILNQMSREDYFSRMAQLAKTVIEWSVKTILGLVLGLQAVQCLVAPAVDNLKNSALHRLLKVVPGIGAAMDSAAETVAGSALVLKNAVGAAGILAIVLICLPPLVKLAACILIFRLLCAVIQPISDKRMVEGIESISGAAVLLMKILVVSMSIFIISLAMITAAARGR